MRSLFESLAWQALGLPPEITPVPNHGKAINATEIGFDLLSSTGDHSWHELNGHSESTVSDSSAAEEDALLDTTLVSAPPNGLLPTHFTPIEQPTQQDEFAPAHQTTPEEETAPDAAVTPYKTPGTATQFLANTLEPAPSDFAAASMDDKNSITVSETGAVKAQHESSRQEWYPSAALREAPHSGSDSSSAPEHFPTAPLEDSNEESEPAQLRSNSANAAPANQPARPNYSNEPHRINSAPSHSTPELRLAIVPEPPQVQRSEAAALLADTQSTLAPRAPHSSDVPSQNFTAISAEPNPMSPHDTFSHSDDLLAAQSRAPSPAATQSDGQQRHFQNGEIVRPATTASSVLLQGTPGMDHLVTGSPLPGYHTNTEFSPRNNAPAPENAPPSTRLLPHPTQSDSAANRQHISSIHDHSSSAGHSNAVASLPLSDKFLSPQNTPAITATGSFAATSQIFTTAASAQGNELELIADAPTVATYSIPKDQLFSPQPRVLDPTQPSIAKLSPHTAAKSDQLASSRASQSIHASVTTDAPQETLKPAQNENSTAFVYASPAPSAHYTDNPVQQPLPATHEQYEAERYQPLEVPQAHQSLMPDPVSTSLSSEPLCAQIASQAFPILQTSPPIHRERFAADTPPQQSCLIDSASDSASDESQHIIPPVNIAIPEAPMEASHLLHPAVPASALSAVPSIGHTQLFVTAHPTTTAEDTFESQTLIANPSVTLTAPDIHREDRVLPLAQPSQPEMFQPATLHRAEIRAFDSAEPFSPHSIPHSAAHFPPAIDSEHVSHSAIQHLVHQHEAPQSAAGILPTPPTHTITANSTSAPNPLTASDFIQRQITPHAAPPSKTWASVHETTTSSADSDSSQQSSSQCAALPQYSPREISSASTLVQESSINHRSTTPRPQTDPPDEALQSPSIYRNTEHLRLVQATATPLVPRQTYEHSVAAESPTSAPSATHPHAFHTEQRNAGTTAHVPTDTYLMATTEPITHPVSGALLSDPPSHPSSEGERRDHRRPSPSHASDTSNFTANEFSKPAASLLSSTYQPSPHNFAAHGGQREQHTSAHSTNVQLSEREPSLGDYVPPLRATAASKAVSALPSVLSSSPIQGTSSATQLRHPNQSKYSTPPSSADHQTADAPITTTLPAASREPTQNATSPANSVLLHSRLTQLLSSQFTPARFAPRANLRRLASQPEPPPLHIEIGRIDIDRSDLLPSLAHTRRTRPKAKFTLDQYLKQRTRRR